MKTDLGSDDMVVHLSAPQMVTTERVVVGGVSGGTGGTGGRASTLAVECGRRLLLAARAGDTETVRNLMAKGAPFTTDWLGTSPLHVAAANDHCETVAVLLRAGVSRDARTKVERTPLHLAAYAGHHRTVQALIDGGALVDARDLLQMTPLHWAVERGHTAAARALLAGGADPHAVSKFRKTPLQLAAPRPHLLRLIDDALKQREADRSVHALVSENTTAEALAPAATTHVDSEQLATLRLQKISEVKTASPSKNTSSPEKKTVKAIKLDKLPSSSPSSAAAGGGGGGGAVGGAEALLRRHGITLLPADDGSTVLSALQSGRTVVLSDAGKLMLKESSSGGGAVTSPAGGGGGGVVLRATPVVAPPPGVKVFTLNTSAKLKEASVPVATLATATTPATLTRIAADKTDVQQVKVLRVGGDTSASETGVAASGGGGAAQGAGAGAARGSVRIIMNRRNFRKLIATATKAADITQDGNSMEVDEEVSSGSEEGDGGGAGSGGGESVVVVPEQFVRSMSPQYLRSQLLCAHAAIHQLTARLRRAKRRIAALQEEQQQHQHTLMH